MINFDYQKRKNTELFESLEKPDSLFLSNTQNYIPIYNRFFTLNDTNYNNINLNNKWYITKISEPVNQESKQLYFCNIRNIQNKKSKSKEVFFKLAPLLDPYKFLIGKYSNDDTNLFHLPSINSNNENTNPKFLDTNNSAYVDGLFLFLTSKLIHTVNFINGVDCYGSFLAVKNDFKINIFDDIDYLNNSEFFNKNKNVLFNVDDYEHLLDNENQKLKPITIQHDISMKSNISINSFNNEMFEDIFCDTIHIENMDELPELTNMNEYIINKDDITNNDDNKVTLKSNSTCSSRSSYTDNDNTEDDCNECDDFNISNEDDNEYKEITDEDNSEINDDSSSTTGTMESYEEEKIEATIPKFPVQVICMEYCDNTFDDLILQNDLKEEEWFSAFMQIIMILIIYQETFAFTHNDLHTNNVMYNHTDKKYIYYLYKKKYYKVPTYGRIFKIIDFGRSIFKYNGNIFCSDSFQQGGDAASQYNTEPYFNDKKPRLEPNYSFDLCRLACSIFDYIVDDFDEIRDLSKCKNPVTKLIVEWCLDDKGINMLYKNNGIDRYPDFKLYKMIARCVHKHTPQAQLERPEFNKYSEFKGDIPNANDVINIDEIPSCI